LYVFKTKLQQNSNKIKILVKQNHDFVLILSLFCFDFVAFLL